MAYVINTPIIGYQGITVTETVSKFLTLKLVRLQVLLQLVWR